MGNKRTVFPSSIASACAKVANQEMANEKRAALKAILMMLMALKRNHTDEKTLCCIAKNRSQRILNAKTIEEINLALALDSKEEGSAK